MGETLQRQMWGQISRMGLERKGENRNGRRGEGLKGKTEEKRGVKIECTAAM